MVSLSGAAAVGPETDDILDRPFKSWIDDDDAQKKEEEENEV